MKKLRRSMLFCPATNPKLYLDAPLYKPDCIIFDLEDSVNYSQKLEARDLLAEALKSLSFGSCEVFARINPLYSEFGYDDVRVLVKAGLRNMRLPMCESADDVLELDKLLTEVEKSFGLETGVCKIQCSIETPLAVENVFDIAKSSKRVISVSFGAEDYTRLLGVDRTKNAKELFYARSRVCNAASIARIDAMDTVWADFADVEGFENEVKEAKQLGFSGKSCIHPSQIETVHNVFTPDITEVEKSLRILKAVKSANIEKGGVIQVDGKMVDVPVIEKAKRIVELAKGANLVGENYE